MGNEKNNWTHEQLAVLDAQKNTLVYASAGSGKTTVMVEKIIRKLKEGKQIGNILVLSYTNASATDMKLKIVKELTKCIDNEQNDIKEILVEQFDNLAFADICTMDSFCGKLIRENFVKTGLTPNLQQMDEVESDDLKKRVISDVISEEYDKRQYDFLNVMNKTTSIADDTPLKDVVLKLFEAKNIKPNPDEFIRGIKNSVTDNPDSLYGRIILEHYKEVAIEKKRIVEDLLNNTYSYLPDDSISKKRLTEAIENLKIIANIKDAESVASLQLVDSTSKKSEKDKSIPDNVKDFINKKVKGYVVNLYNSLKNDLIKNYAGYNTKEANEFIGVVLRVLDEFEKKYKEEKEKNRKLDFTDLSRVAIRLLKDNEVMESVRNKYELVFVDEYQDINPLQEEILQKITNNNLFMVGDIKQSIYAFRNADSKIFSYKKDLFEQDGSQGIALPMTKNFRSNDGILHFVDDVFSAIMTKNVGGVNYKDESLFLKDNGNYDNNVEINVYKPEFDATLLKLNGVYSVEKHVEGMSENEKCEYVEGLKVAEKIKGLVGTHIKIGSEIREVKYSDIAILFRKRTGGADGFLKALEDARIPTVSDGFREDAGKKYIKEINALLRAMNNEREDIPYVGYLLSYFGGMDERDLQELRCKNANIPLCEVVEETSTDCSALGQKCKHVVEFLEKCRKSIEYKTVGEFLSELVIDECFDIYSSAGAEGAEGYYAVRAYIRNITLIGESLNEILDYIDNAGIPKIFADSDGSENAVNIVTAHGSKGLEYPIVFLVRAGAKWSSNKQFDREIIFDKDLGAGLKLYNEEECSKIKSLAFSAICVKQMREEVDENIRLLYVALTRAQSKLYITSCDKNGVGQNMFYPTPIADAKCFLDIIYSAGFVNSRVRHAVTEYTVDTKNDDVPFANGYVIGKGDESIKEQLSAVYDFNYKYEDSVKLSPKYSVTMLNRIDNVSVTKTPNLVASETDRRLLGIAYHTLMEHIDFGFSTKKELNELIDNLVEGGILDEKYASMIERDRILNAINNEIIKDGIKGKYIREKSFMMRISAKELGLSQSVDDEVIVQGTLDLAFLNDKPTIIDFKYSTLSEEQLINKYRKQLLLYKKALLKSYENYKDEDVCIKLYSFILGKFIDIK